MNLYRANNTNNNGNFSYDPLAVIFNEGFWRLHLVSPLYNLQYDKVKLKQYVSKIRQALVSSVNSDKSAIYIVQIEEEPNLKYTDADASGLTINVSTEDTNKTNKIKYSAILLSWGVSNAVHNTTHLPYMLERGEQRIGNTLRATLCAIFDCNIKQFSFTQQVLLQFGFNLLEQSRQSSRSTDPFTLLFRTPDDDTKSKLALSLELEVVSVIWNGTKDVVENKSDLVKLAYQMLQNQIFYMSDLDITELKLCEIKLPKAEVQSNGSVKMKTAEDVNCVFSVLNEIIAMYPRHEIISETVIQYEEDDST